MEMERGFTMGHRPGRKRAQRGYLVEKLRPRKDLMDRLLTGEQPHRRGLPEPLRLSEKAGTVLGRLNLMGFISDEQHEAGQRFQVSVGEYLSSIGAPRGGGGAGRGYPCAGSLNCDPCECLNRKLAFKEACGALDDAGHRAGVAVAHVAVHGEPLAEGFYWWLKRGLSALAKHYGIGQRRKRAA